MGSSIPQQQLPPQSMMPQWPQSTAIPKHWGNSATPVGGSPASAIAAGTRSSQWSQDVDGRSSPSPTGGKGAPMMLNKTFMMPSDQRQSRQVETFSNNKELESALLLAMPDHYED